MAGTTKKLGKRIQELRKSKKFTQSELAELIGVEVVTISRIENGTRFPKKENIENIAQALDVQIKDLFDFEAPRSKSAIKRNIQAMLKKAETKDLLYFEKVMNSYFEAINAR